MEGSGGVPAEVKDVADTAIDSVQKLLDVAIETGQDVAQFVLGSLGTVLERAAAGVAEVSKTIGGGE